MRNEESQFVARKFRYVLHHLYICFEFHRKLLLCNLSTYYAARSVQIMVGHQTLSSQY